MSQYRNNLVEVVRPSYPFDVGSRIDLSQLQDKTILITGGASGFGEAFLRKWAANGANVIIGDINSSKGETLIAEVRESSNNQNLHFLYCNVADWQSQVDFFRAAVKLSPHGGIDAVVANAGIVGDAPPFDDPPDNLGTLEEPPCVDLKVLEVNLFGVMYTTHLAFHYLPRNPGSENIHRSSSRDRHILLIGSMAGIFPMAAQVQYCTSKHAIVGLYRSLMCTAFTKGIRINLLMPYFTDTPILSSFGRAILAGVPLGKPEDVVDAGTRLMASNMSGKALCVGPRFMVDQDWALVPGSSKDSKTTAIWEVYGQDFDDVDTFTWRYIRMINQLARLNGWRSWIWDMAAALLYPFRRT